MRAVVGQQQLQAAARQHGQGHRVVSELVALWHAQTQLAALGLLERLAQRIVLEHQQAVEQRLAGAADPALDIVQRAVFVLAQLQVLHLQRGQPVAQRLLGRQLHGNGKAVDKQAKHLLAAAQLDRSTGHGGAEAQAALAGQARQQQGPGGLY